MRLIASIFCLTVMCSNTNAQYYTYNHDSPKKNQITVMEIGLGGLNPKMYYNVFHKNYMKSAAEKNKITYRSMAGMSAYNQVGMAEKIDSSLTQRAEVEALNVADRSGGELDLAWKAEGNKLESKLQAFLDNISRIIPSGGTPEDKSRWDEYYLIFKYAIQSTQEAYMPNSQREKQYLKIYADICRQNEILIRQLVIYSNNSKTKELLEGESYGSADVSTIVGKAKNRWKVASKIHKNKPGENVVSQ